MARNVEIRERVGGIFNHADSLLYPKTHVNMVDGLLTDGVLSESIIPDYLFGGTRYGGTINSYGAQSPQFLHHLAYANTGEGDPVYITDLIKPSTKDTNKGLYFDNLTARQIKQDPNTDITLETLPCKFVFNSSIVDGEFGDAPYLTTDIEVGDLIVYTHYQLLGGTYYFYFNVRNNTESLATSNKAGLMSADLYNKLYGIAAGANNYSHPTYTVRSVDTDGVVVLDTFTSDAQGHVTGIGTRTLPNATTSVPGVMSSADKTKLDGIASNANNYSLPTASATVLGGVKVGSGLSIASGVLANSSPNATHTGDVTGSGALTIANDVVTNTKLANMAQNTIKGRVTAGAGDPEDLTATQIRTMLNVEDGANNYSHPTGLAKSQDLTSVETIDSISFDTNGHITTLTKQAIRTGSTSVTGLLQLATGAELTTALNASKATTPVGVKAMIDYFAGMSRYASLTAANAATVSDGSIALVTVA